MKTRRKSKAAANEEEEEEEEQTLTVNIPDDIDLETLESAFPDFNLANPSQVNILAFYRTLAEQFNSVQDLQDALQNKTAAFEKMEVELDQAYQDKERLESDNNSSLDNVSSEMAKLKQENSQLVAAQSGFQTQIATLNSSLSASRAETDSLKQRIEDTEREKRDLVGVVSRLKQEGSSHSDEVHTLRANLKEARQEHQALEGTVRELRSTETSTKFKLETLTQQLQLAQAESERLNSELAEKVSAFSTYRRTKHAEVVELQTAHDALTQTHASLQTSFKHLQSTHTAQTHQLSQALTRVQSLTGQLAEQETTYASEASTMKRLVFMMEEREKQAKDIVEDIEQKWAEVGERTDRREQELRDECERERTKREEAEKRAETLQAVLHATENAGHGADHSFGDMSNLSPTVAIASKAQRSGKTFTEVYSEYVRLQEDYTRKSAEFDHMDRTLTAVLAQIEERAPILSQQRAEYDRLQNESAQLASQLAQALADRDAQGAAAHAAQAKLVSREKETELLEKQLTDLGRQVQGLLREVGRRDNPNMPSDAELAQLNIPTINGDAPAEDIQSLITNNLVLFNSIPELQATNQKQLKIIRELGAKMENEEKEYRAEMEREQAEAVREAHEAMLELGEQLERQKKSSEEIIRAYVREGEALRGIIARGGNASSSIAPNGAGTINGTDGPASTLVTELTEVQEQFASFKTEVGVDSARLRDQVTSAMREAGQLSAALAKANAKIEYLTDRHRMAQDQFALHTRDLEDLTKRNEQLFLQYTRVEVECNRAIEDLQSANGKVEQLRNESANLRAEKKIWESVQSRLAEENRNLAMERSHLSDLMGNVQKMHNDLERSGENDRRRLESQLQMLEGQTQDLRAQVTQERDNTRNATLNKEIEVKDLQARLDRTTQELSKTRESLIGAETSKKHFETRTEELTRQLQGNDEKLAVYERRGGVSNGVARSINEDLTKEQQLEAEVAELRSSLKVAEVDLAAAKANVHQFQEISQANESALATMNTTYDEYKTSTEAQFARQQSEYQALKERLESTQKELETLQASFGENQRTIESERTAWLNDKKTLEGMIVDMTNSEKHSDSDRNSRESEIRQQEERAKAAEERYSNEVLAHAESIKSLDALKRQLSALQRKAGDYQTAAETAAAKLAASEGSWKHQKDALYQEVAGLTARCQDLSAQNGILHQHLESVSSQAARIRQAADTSASITPADKDDDADTKLSELRSVVGYLRKEKEIVDLQLELAKQENVRLKAQIEHVSHNLEETRNALSEERDKAANNVATEAQHAELIERINQLNILRESNATLRAESENHAKRARELDAKLTELSKELEPAKEQAGSARAELEAKDLQIQRLEEENGKWQERNQQLLTKYDRIDPAEVQAFKDEIQAQKEEISQLKADAELEESGHASQVARIEALEASVRSHKESANNNNTNFRSRMGALNQEMSALKSEKNALTTRVNELTVERDAALSQKSALEAPAVKSIQESTEFTALKSERDALLAEKANWMISSSVAAPNSETNPGWEAEKAALVKARDDAEAAVIAAKANAEKVSEEARNFRMSSEKYSAKIADLTKARNADSEKAAAQQAAAVAQALKNVNSSSVPEDISKKHADELAALQAKLEAQHKKELDAALADAKKDTASPSQEEAIAAALAAHKEETKAAHEQAIAQAMEAGRMEQLTKSKLKDAQLVRAQKKVKDLEAQIAELRNAGIPPEVSSAPTVPKPATVPAASNAAASTSASASAGPTPAVRKPGPGPAVRGRGAAQRGGLSIRGAAPGGRVLLGKPAATSSAPPAAGGVSIMGAATKRPRESEDATQVQDSLAKRLKPADPTSKPPVSIRRPPPPAS